MLAFYHIKHFEVKWMTEDSLTYKNLAFSGKVNCVWLVPMIKVSWFFYHSICFKG